MPRADVERMAAERGDGVDDGQRAVLARDCRKLPHRIQHAGRRLRVHDGDDVGAGRFELPAQRLRVRRASPFRRRDA